MNQVEFTQFIKQEALALGFLSCGISRAEFLEEEAKPLESWLNKGFNGQMQWMENNFDKRLDPRILVEGCISVISFSLNYFPSEVQNSDSFKISKYAYGNDYHEVIKEKLQVLFSKMKEKFPALEGRAFVDSAPIMDKAWAKRAGLGWVGKNTNLINPQQGSFFFLAEMLVNLELEYDQTFANDHCGTCTKCIDACPTEAIIAPYQIDGSKCISYYTIELKEQLPNDMQGKFDDWIFGCDVCQDVCPWNKFSLAHQEEKLKLNKQIMHYSKSDWQDLKEEEFKILFKHSPIKRTKYEGFMRNIRFVS